LDREGVDVDHAGAEAGLTHDIDVVVDHVLLRSDEKDIHLPLIVVLIEDRDVDVHIVDVEGNVLLGFPLDALVELIAGHDRQVDLSQDDGVA